MLKLSHKQQTIELTRQSIARDLAAQIIADVSKLEARRCGAGVRVSALIPLINAHDATSLVLTSTDGFSAELPIEIAADGIVVFELDGEALPPRLGGPFRFFTIASAECGTAVADHCKNVKSLASLVLG